MRIDLQRCDFFTNDVFLFYKLHFVLGYSVKDISDGTGICRSTLYKYVHHIKNKYKL